MFRRLIAVSFVTIWFLLFAIEFCEELGFFEYNEVETDQAIETTLASFGEAIKSSDALQPTPIHFPSFQPVAPRSLLIRGALVPCFRDETNHSKRDFKIYKLYRSFLI
jgi:hypothetical protein